MEMGEKQRWITEIKHKQTNKHSIHLLKWKGNKTVPMYTHHNHLDDPLPYEVNYAKRAEQYWCT